VRDEVKEDDLDKMLLCECPPYLLLPLALLGLRGYLSETRGWKQIQAYRTDSLNVVSL